MLNTNTNTATNTFTDTQLTLIHRSKLSNYKFKQYNNEKKTKTTSSNNNSKTDHNYRNKFNNTTPEKQQQISYRRACEGGLPDGSRSLQLSARQEGWVAAESAAYHSSNLRLVAAELGPDHHLGNTFSEQRTQNVIRKFFDENSSQPNAYNQHSKRHKQNTTAHDSSTNTNTSTLTPAQTQTPIASTRTHIQDTDENIPNIHTNSTNHTNNTYTEYSPQQQPTYLRRRVCDRIYIRREATSPTSWGEVY